MTIEINKKDIEIKTRGKEKRNEDNNGNEWKVRVALKRRFTGR